MHELWTSDGGVRLFALELGRGPTLVFFHGGLADHRTVLPIVQPLSNRFRVVVPDLRGSGRSVSSEALTFEALSRDLERLLDHLGVETAFVGGISSGTGPAVHFGLTRARRAMGLVLVHPVYAGTSIGYSAGQAGAFERMDRVASRAAHEGVEVLRELYFGQLPDEIAERAWAMASTFDAASVSATSHFIASGAQPFSRAEDLERVEPPTLLIPGDDEIHPRSVSELYSARIPSMRVEPATSDITEAIGGFLDEVVASTQGVPPSGKG